MFQCTSCFGVLLNSDAVACDRHSVGVSMHFVLWGTSQRDGQRARPGACRFNALRALGYFSTSCKRTAAKLGRCFNALRALGYFSTPKTIWDEEIPWAFQCTSCFGVLLNLLFGALVSLLLLFQCTSCFGVLLNKLGRCSFGSPLRFQCTSCFGVLLNDGRKYYLRLPLAFQCTSCFGVLLNFHE